MSHKLSPGDLVAPVAAFAVLPSDVYTNSNALQ